MVIYKRLLTHFLFVIANPWLSKANRIELSNSYQTYCHPQAMDNLTIMLLPVYDFWTTVSRPWKKKTKHFGSESFCLNTRALQQRKMPKKTPPIVISPKPDLRNKTLSRVQQQLQRQPTRPRLKNSHRLSNKSKRNWPMSWKPIVRKRRSWRRT